MRHTLSLSLIATISSIGRRPSYNSDYLPSVTQRDKRTVSFHSFECHPGEVEGTSYEH